jgi:hypothetical protein
MNEYRKTGVHMTTKQRKTLPKGRGGWLLLCFAVGLLLLLGAELFVERHPAFHWTEMYGFSAGFGLVSAGVFLGLAKALRGFVQRDEDYYDN